MFSRLKGFMGMVSVAAADESGVSVQRPSRARQNTGELDARSAALRERIQARADKVETLVSELGNERSEPMDDPGPAVLYPPEGLPRGRFIPVATVEPLQAIRVHTDFVIRNKNRAVVKGKPGDWIVRGPDGDYSVYSDRDFRRSFQRI